MPHIRYWEKMRRMPRFLHSLFSAAAFALVCLLLLVPASCGHRTPRPRRPLPEPTGATAVPPAEETKSSTTPAAAPGPQLSDAERKAAARAAFAEGVQLQEQNDCAGALPRFEVAERMYDAPTHLLHIAQCQAAIGRLVEAQENYATLGHLTLNAQAPAAFREAQEAARAEGSRLRPRIPTLRITANPPAESLKNLTVQINGTQLPPDLVGVARPINPGRYRVTMTAGPGRTGTGEAEIKEGETKTLEVRLSK